MDIILEDIIVPTTGHIYLFFDSTAPAGGLQIGDDG